MKILMAILILDKLDFITSNAIRNKERLYRMKKRSFQQEFITILNVYALKNKDSKYMKKLIELIT